MFMQRFVHLRQVDFIVAVLPSNEQTSGDVEYNERFWWRSSGEMTSAFKQALHQGAPFPIVSLAEYFSLHQEGFSWGLRYREAGYYASIMLWYIITSVMKYFRRNHFESHNLVFTVRFYYKSIILSNVLRRYNTAL